MALVMPSPRNMMTFLAVRGTGLTVSQFRKYVVLGLLFTTSRTACMPDCGRDEERHV
jgi:hypothetical protein